MKLCYFNVTLDLERYTFWTIYWARLSNSDTIQIGWICKLGSWRHDHGVGISYAKDDSSTNIADMISTAFWLVSGKNFKLTRSDDPHHTPLLQTNCVWVDFHSDAKWQSSMTLEIARSRRIADAGVLSCMPQYHDGRQTTDVFQQANCSAPLKRADQIGFWYHWGDGDRSVKMIGGGGGNCSRAVHRIGKTQRPFLTLFSLNLDTMLSQ